MSGKLLHLHLADGGPVEEGEITLADGSKRKVFWKDVLIEGTYPMSPGPGGAVDQPMTVIREGESDYSKRIISMSDVIEAHEGSAFKYVTIPTKHTDELLDNTGYVPSPEGVIQASDAVKVIERDGKAVLRSALAFTEPDVEGKVERGTIPDCSGGFFFGHTNKHKRKQWRCSMKHVCLSKVPFMGNLNPFKTVFASDDDIPDDVDVEFYEFADGDTGTSGDTKTAEIIWDERFALSGIRQQVENALSPDPGPITETEQADSRPMLPQPSYYVQDVGTEDGTNYTALVQEYFKGDSKRLVIPFTRSDDKVSISPATRWTEAREAMIAASDEDFESMSADAVLDRIRINLSDILGNDLFVPEALTFDQRVRIKNQESGVEFVAPFLMGNDGSVQVAQPAYWNRMKAAEPDTKREPDQPVSSPTVTLSDEPKFDTSTPEGRLKAAQHKRRQLLVR